MAINGFRKKAPGDRPTNMGDKSQQKKPICQESLLEKNVYRPILMLSLFLALLCTFITYPGIFYSDSYVRVHTGYAVLNSIVKTITGHRMILETGNAFTVIPSFLIAVSYGLTGHVGFYTFFQAFLFFMMVFLLIRELNPPGQQVLILMAALSPMIYGVSVYYEANVGCVAGIILLLLLLRRTGNEKTKMQRTGAFLLIVFAAFITVGYRTNALTVIPVLMIYVWKTQKDRIKRLVPILAMVVGIAMTWMIPWIFGVQSESNASTGFVWEMITTIQRMDPETQSAYMDYLDEIGGEGTTQEAVLNTHGDTVDSFMWGSGFNTEKLSRPGTLGKVLRKYLQLMTERPADWFRMKLDFVQRAMGISKMLELNEYDYNRWERMGEYGFNDSMQRKAFHQSYLSFNQLIGFYSRRPWVAFLASLIMVIVEHFRNKEKSEIYALIYWLAVFSYAAYLVVIVVFQIRMFYPALLLLSVLDASIIAEWIQTGIHRIQKRSA